MVAGGSLLGLVTLAGILSGILLRDIAMERAAQPRRAPPSPGVFAQRVGEAVDDGAM
jgi:hypothetical protein